MAQEHVETIRAIYAGWSKGDFRTSADRFDPHVVLVIRPEFGPESPEPQSFIGREAVAAYTREFMLKPWAKLTVKAEEIIAAGDTVLVDVRQRGVGTTSGATAEADYATLWSFRADKVIRIESFRDRAEAREAAGLSE